MKVSVLLAIISVAYSAVIPRVANDDDISITTTDDRQYQLKENVNFIKVTGSTDIQKLKDDYPNGEIVNDLNNPRKKLFIFDVDQLLMELTNRYANDI
ncbi:hypothetical protein JTP64_003013 [Candida tropicalis]|nr:hypothetical protein JTP64_003013 [Candida tropicalis]